MIGGTISGSSRNARIASVKVPDTRHRPMAASVPRNVASAAEHRAITKLCPKLDSHSALVKRLWKCCSETPSQGSERYVFDVSETGIATSDGTIRIMRMVQAAM